MRNTWKIWIDTGGTFTDCIAITPNGEKKRTKVLSSSCIRGVIHKETSDGWYRFDHNWQINRNIFFGYTFSLLTGKNEERITVEAIDLANKQLKLSKRIDIEAPTDFELTAHEEAPVLAIRVITHTALDETFPEIELRLGTTKATNALLERKGSKVALLVSKGFKDLLYIGNQQRPDLFQLNIPEPNILASHILEVDERISSEGTIIKELGDHEIDKLVNQLKQLDIDAVAISLINAYIQPQHELVLAKAIKELALQNISLSHQIVPAIKYLARTQTTLVNAYLSPVLSQYLEGISSQINPKQDQTLLVMSSAGGLIDLTSFMAKDALLSGPAGGVVGAAAIAAKHNYHKVLTLDMGGTSTDTARYDGKLDFTFFTTIDGIEMRNPTVAIETVAAGGGSICSYQYGRLQVGPESAGAFPGPACYGGGGPLTVTDVNVLLGKMDVSKMGIPIRIEEALNAANQLIEKIHQDTGVRYELLDLLKGLEQVANEKMADAIRKISVSKGFDPKEYALLAFGGAGGMHVCAIADLLNVAEILVPVDAGLLSAYGIGQAKLSRMVERFILKPLSEVEQSLPNWIDQLKQEGIALFNDMEGEVEVDRASLFFRLKGQENTIEVAYKDKIDLLKAFKKQYEELFGYFDNKTVVELESIKVIVQSKAKAGDDQHDEIKDIKSAQPLKELPIPAQKDQNIPFYNWDELEVGTEIIGPATLMNQFATVFLEKNWTAMISHQKDVIMKRSLSNLEAINSSQLEAIELELFANRFTSIAEEMGAQLQRTALSVNVKERLDYSCAILAPDASLLVNAPHIPVHLGSLGICTRLVKSALPIRPGDVIMTNHPKYGGSHLPDITLVSGAFTNKGELIGYVINRAHHAEIGGKSPGSMPPDATSLVEEGVAFVPTYVFEAGESKMEEVENSLSSSKYPSRSVADNLADISAAIASLRKGITALEKLVEEHGLDKVKYYMSLIKKKSAAAMAAVIERLKGQTFEATESIDDGHIIKVKIQVKSDKVIFDFAGTSNVHPHNLNANVSIVHSAIIYVLRLWCEENIPLNEGLMEQVEIILPKSFLNPDFEDDPNLCPAVVGGNTDISQRLVDTLLKALQLSACSQGTMNNLLFGNASFGYYETICGGTGAGLGFDGRSAVHQHM
ncbi:MAG: hydantoinase B/oxoprolinase family protein, partial [Bacteroidota bacterium]